MSDGCQKDVYQGSGRGLEGVLKLSRRYLGGVWEVVWRLCAGCLESGQVYSGQVESAQVKSGQVKSD